MMAFFLAAGHGKRLRPLTEKIPKCLVPIRGRPLIEYWLDLFEKYAINDILISANYLYREIESYLSKHGRGKINISYFYEEPLLGSGGTIKVSEKALGKETDFFIIYADNLTTVDLGKMLSFHAQHSKPLTLGVFKSDSPCDSGIVNVDDSGVVTRFEEKPRNPKSDLAAAGLYIARRKIFSYFPVMNNFDLGHDVFPGMIGNMVAYEIKEYFIDIGTPEHYEKANIEFPDKS